MPAGSINNQSAADTRFISSLPLEKCLQTPQVTQFLPPSCYQSESWEASEGPKASHGSGSALQDMINPQHFTPHCLRHTYASILLSEGVSPVYVQEQLGHATIELTVSTYGRWLKKKSPGALDRLDFMAEVASGSIVVAKVGLLAKTALTPLKQGPYLQALTMEPATRIDGRPVIGSALKLVSPIPTKGAKPPCTIPTKGTHPLRNPTARWFHHCVRLQIALQPGAGDWNRTSDLRFTNFPESHLRQPKPTRNNKPG